MVGRALGEAATHRAKGRGAAMVEESAHLDREKGMREAGGKGVRG